MFSFSQLWTLPRFCSFPKAQYDKKDYCTEPKIILSVWAQGETVLFWPVCRRQLSEATSVLSPEVRHEERKGPAKAAGSRAESAAAAVKKRSSQIRNIKKIKNCWTKVLKRGFLLVSPTIKRSHSARMEKWQCWWQKQGKDKVYSPGLLSHPAVLRSPCATLRFWGGSFQLTPVGAPLLFSAVIGQSVHMRLGAGRPLASIGHLEEVLLQNTWK